MIRIRRATMRDFTGISIVIHNAIFNYVYPDLNAKGKKLLRSDRSLMNNPEAIREIMRNRPEIIFVAIDNKGEVRGVLRINVSEQTIPWFFVSTPRQGIGSKLWAQGYQYLQTNNIDMISCDYTCTFITLVFS